MCAKPVVYGSHSKTSSSLNDIAHRYRFDKFRVFQQRLFVLSSAEAREFEMSRTDFVLWRNELRHSIGYGVIPQSNNLDEIIRYAVNYNN